MENGLGNTPLDAAINKVGGQVALATACNVTPQAVNQWAQKGKPPAGRVLAIEAATGISRHELRPDIFGPMAETSDRPQ